MAYLSDQDKEVFYTEVKRLIKIIKTKIARGTDDADMNSDSEGSGCLVRQKDNSFQFAGSTKIQLAWLEPLLSIQVLHSYPKMALLAYEAFSEYIDVFDNEFCSLYNQFIDKFGHQHEKSRAKFYSLNDRATTERSQIDEFY